MTQAPRDPPCSRDASVEEAPADPRHGRGLATFWAMALALVAYLFRDAWLHGHVLGQADLLFQFLPWEPYRPAGLRSSNHLLLDVPAVFFPFLHHAREAIRAGDLPLWVSGLGSGQPFFAAAQSSVLSPFSLFTYLLPFPHGFTVDVAARLVAGGLGMFLFLRALPVGTPAALFGGVGYLLNPFSVVWLEHPLAAAAAGLPWLLLLAHRASEARAGATLAGFAVATGAMLLTGHPETVFKAALAAGGYAVYRGLEQRRPLRTILLAAGGMGLGALLASVQIVPMLEYIAESRILERRSAADGHPLTVPGRAFIASLVPDFWGSPLRSRFVLPYGNYNEQQAYPGIVVWVFALASLAHPRLRRCALFFLAAALMAMLVMYGTPLALLVARLIPPLQVAALSRFGLVAITGLLVAAAIGLDAAVRQAQGRSWRPAVLALAAGAAIAAVIGAFLFLDRAFLEESRQLGAATRATTWALQLLAAALVLAVLVSRLPHPWLPAAVIVLLAVDLLSFADRYHRFVPPEHVFPPVAELAIPSRDRTIFRVTGWGDTLLPNTALWYGLQDVRLYDGVLLREYSALLDVGFHFNGGTHQLTAAAAAPLLDLLNVKYVLAPPSAALPAERFAIVHAGPTHLYLNLRAYPRAYLADAFVTMDREAMRRAIRDGMDLRRTALLDVALPHGQRPLPGRASAGEAEIVEYGDARVMIRTAADGQRLLVLTDVYYPGWVARLDGREVPILRANHSFRAVVIPEGRHTVEFAYEPASFRIGLVGTGVAGAAIVGLLIGGRRRRAAPGLRE